MSDSRLFSLPPLHDKGGSLLFHCQEALSASGSATTALQLAVALGMRIPPKLVGKTECGARGRDGSRQCLVGYSMVVPDGTYFLRLSDVRESTLG